MKQFKRSLVWLRRDYRLQDNAALSMALQQSEKVLICFIFDTHILDLLASDDRRIPFIMDSIREVDTDLSRHHSSLVVRYGTPEDHIPNIIATYQIDALFHNRDYEPYAVARDHKVHQMVSVPVITAKDSVIHEKDEIKTKTDGYYTVFTPYKNNWLTKDVDDLFSISLSANQLIVPTEDSSIQEDRWYDLMGFTTKDSLVPGGRAAALQTLDAFVSNIHDYDSARDFPGLDQTSRLSPYLRFGCVSIRECVTFANQYSSVGAQIWLSELIWRDFYQMVCATHPNCDQHAIKPIYDTIQWQGEEEWFTAWCNGQTGFPIVDAAMRQLNQTGFMHNRCRMITASFLCKTLLIDWRKGESYFAKQLLDFDFASNNGGWQWSSSSGCDAQPYFRIFNPYSQSEKFDASGDYIRKYCPELKDCTNKDIHNPVSIHGYPKPIVDYKTMRAKALDMYSVVKSS